MDTLLTAHIARMNREDAEIAIRARVQTAYLGDHHVLARVLGRYKIVLDTRDRGFARHLMLDGYWESWATKFLCGRLKPGMTVVDVGANYGYYTLLFGGTVGPEGQVIAVEPNPQIASVLGETVELNGFSAWTEVHALALSDRSGEATFFVPDGEPKNGLIIGHRVSRPGETFPVPVSTLDAITAGRKVDLVKIDAEGGEPAILRGMADLIARCRPAILLEFNAARYEDAGAILDGLLATYERVHTISFEGRSERVTRNAVLTEKHGQDWLLFFE